MKKSHYICILVSLIIICIFSIPVLADSIYFPVVSGVSYTRHFYEPTGGNTVVTRDDADMIFDGNDIRIVTFIRNASSTSQTVSWIAMSLNTFKFGSTSANTSASSKFIDGIRVYYSNFYYAWKYLKVSFNGVTPTIYDFTDLSSSADELARAYDIAFNGNVPSEPINWGILKNVSFEQRTRGTGYINYKNNLDYISWDSNLDSNNNDISDCQVQIRAVTGLWSATEQSDLNLLDMHDFVTDQYVDLGTYNASVGTMSFSWERVLNGISGYDSPFVIPLDETFIDEVWKKVGWYYEVRLVPPDAEPLTWQQVYTPLSTSVKDSQTILNNSYITNEVINTYQNVTQINNQNQMIINYNNTETTIVNPESEPQYDTDSDLYSDILRKILNGILSIPLNIQNATQNITQSITEIPQGIASLFTFNAAEELPTDQEMTELITEKVENTYIGDLVLALGRIKTAFSTYKGTYSTIGQITIPYLGYYWDGEYVTVFTGTTFNLYDVVKTPSGTINVFYETYLSIVDGIIYITLLRMLFKRLIHSLETE